MADYYIRTPDREESRGPFDASQLLTLGDAGQITENTLHYDENREEWIPIALNEQLKADVFPDREKLSLKVNQSNDNASDAEANDAPKEQGGISVTDMLAAAERDTKETRHLKKKEESFHKAAALSTSSIGLMMLLSAVTLLLSFFVEGSPASESRPCWRRTPRRRGPVSPTGPRRTPRPPRRSRRWGLRSRRPRHPPRRRSSPPS